MHKFSGTTVAHPVAVAFRLTVKERHVAELLLRRTGLLQRFTQLARHTPRDPSRLSRAPVWLLRDVLAYQQTLMKSSFRMGLSFGLTSGVITTLGLIVGLHAGTNSRAAVLGGILTIAIADSLSDALGIHLAEESKGMAPVLQVWESTVATLLSKFIIAATFAVPLLLFQLWTSVLVSLFWGLAILTMLSFFTARTQHIPAWKVIGEHLLIALSVVIVSYYVGLWVSELQL
jgi:vacuolar iron transporter family protein